MIGYIHFLANDAQERVKEVRENNVAFNICKILEDVYSKYHSLQSED